MKSMKEVKLVYSVVKHIIDERNEQNDLFFALRSKKTVLQCCSRSTYENSKNATIGIKKEVIGVRNDNR